jgi:hypothetical protein
MQTTWRGIANKASSDKGHRFRNLFGMVTVGFLMGCWRFINPKATSILTPGEPGAVILHAGICEGVVGKLAVLP